MTSLATLTLALLAAAPTPDPPWERAASYAWSDGATPAPAPEATSNKPQWVTHRVLPHESLEQIAGRYGVSVSSIVKANKLEAPKVRFRQRLRIYARRTPPPRERVTVTSQPGDNWVSVAVANDVRYRDLRSWNWKHRGDMRPGREIVVYRETAPRPRTVYERQGPPMPQVIVPEGGQSVGKPQRGKLVDGVRIPDTAIFDLRWPEHSWGSTHAVRVAMTALARFRTDSGYTGRIVVGAMSRPKGRRFPPHKSHRTGRDLDVYLPLVGGIPHTWHPTEWQVDWHASWALAMAFIASGEIEAIYLDKSRLRFLFEAARQLGAGPEQLAKVIEFPVGDGPRKGIPIRHGKDHTRHFHIRIRCGDDEPECVPHHRWATRVPRTFDLPETWGTPRPELWRDKTTSDAAPRP